MTEGEVCAAQGELVAVYRAASRVVAQWPSMRNSYSSTEESVALADLLDELETEVRR